jgi:hypothetical protein
MRAVVVLAAAVALTAGTGCGDGESESSPIEDTDLTITLDGDGPGGEPAEEANVECPGADAPPTICEAIEDLPEDPAAPVPADTACTEIYGGPDVVTIEGTLKGQPIDTRLTRENGCEIERFERFAGVLAALFPDYEPGSAAVPGG